MNGPDHYRLAESLLELADSPAGRAMKADGYDPTAEAQVHATLALAAATIDAASWATWMHPTAKVPDHVAANAISWSEATS